MAKLNKAQSDAMRQRVKDTLERLVKTSFPSTLAPELDKDLINILLALVYKESSFYSRAKFQGAVREGSTGGRDYLGATEVVKAINEGKGGFVYQGLSAVGLMQVLGMYFIDKGSKKNGYQELKRLRPDLCARYGLVIPAGSDLYSHILGDDNIEKAIVAGLIVFEGKYKAAKKDTSGNWYFPGAFSSKKFSSRISAAVGAYLGLGNADANGTTAHSYVADIMYGNAYSVANGAVSPSIATADVKTAADVIRGPNLETIVVSGPKKTPGCPT